MQYHPKPRYCYSCAKRIMSVTEKELLAWAWTLIETYGGYQSTTEEAMANITERLRREAQTGYVIQ